jgi:hypothetical protein
LGISETLFTNKKLQGTEKVQMQCRRKVRYLALKTSRELRTIPARQPALIVFNLSIFMGRIKISDVQPGAAHFQY